MLHLLKIEWLKYKNYRTFWILLILITISIPALNYLAYDNLTNLFPKNAKQMQQAILGKPFSFPTVWHTVGWLSGFILFIPSLLTITITTNEFTYKTHRQNVIDGLSRTQFILVKIVEVLLLALFVTLLVFLSALWIGTISKEPENTHGIFENVHQVGYFFVQAVSYLMLAFLLSILIKRAGLVLGIFFMYSMIIEQMIRFFLRFFTNDFGRFLPLETTDELFVNPFSRRFMTPAALEVWQKALPLVFGFSLFYFIVYIFISIYTFKTKDI